MIGTALDDANIRLECWKLGIQMAGTDKHCVTNVAKFATEAYNFVATGADPAPVGRKAKDKSGKTDPMS